jgi:SpoVK/Ycf46/Vps4 family AAA+-type ATPase
MEKIIDKVTKLIKLATNNPSEEESKLAALKVCRLIEDNKLTINNVSILPSLEDVFNNSRGFTDYTTADAQEAARRSAQAAVDREIRRAEERRQQAKEWQDRRKKAREDSVKTITVHSDIVSCEHCKDKIHRGWKAKWIKGTANVYHTVCWERYNEETHTQV